MKKYQQRYLSVFILIEPITINLNPSIVMFYLLQKIVLEIIEHKLYFVNNNDLCQSVLKNPIGVTTDIQFVQN
jgi:hypothetical protein